MTSPYKDKEPGEWLQITKKLIKQHPLSPDEIIDVVLKSWENIFKSNIGSHQIGKHIFPKPQVMGFLLHELIPLEFKRRYPKEWRTEESGNDKDMVYIPDHCCPAR